MRTIFRGVCVAALLTLGATAAQAQNLILNQPTAGTQNIPLATGSPVQIRADGTIELTAAADVCQGTGGGSGPNVTLTASPSTIDRGGSSQISWNVTGGFDSCSTTGGSGTNWSTLNVQTASGSEQFSNLQNSTSFSMTCSNSNGTNTNSVQVTVNTGGSDPADGTVPPECAGISSSLRYAGADDYRTDGSTESFFNFAQMYDNPWPGNSNINRRINVPRNAYIALKFQPSGIVGQSGRVSTELDLAGREKLISISECPGDFRQALPVECRRFDVFTNLFWANTDSQGEVPFGHCPLEPGKDYYLSVAFAGPVNPTDNLCPAANCIFLGQMFVNP